MLNDDIEKTLREHSPVPPAGFAERSDAQVLRLMAEGKTKRRFSWKIVIVCAVLAVFGIATALAATVEDVNAVLYKLWPEAAEFLMPVNASCEDQGIRLEVISAAAGKRDALVTFSLQDLEGGRINENTRTEISLERLFAGYDATAGSVTLLSWNPETETAVFAEEIRTNGFSLPDGSEPMLKVESLYTPEHVKTDLLPLMEQYGTRTDTVPLPEKNVYPIALETYGGEMPEGLQMLDPAGSLEIPLEGHTWLCGFGWIDGLLHVQIRYDNPLDADGNYPAKALLRLKTAGGYRAYDRLDRLPGGITGFWMDEDDNGPVDREEYLFACDPAELEGATLEADIEVYSPDTVMTGDWSVRIPMRMIRNTD